MAGRAVEVRVASGMTEAQLAEMRGYLAEMPPEEVLAGLKFARNRWSARDAGTLRVGRRSIVAREVQAVTAEQAAWRLRNWKAMVASYRRRGYSYPTISRIKRELARVAGG